MFELEVGTTALSPEVLPPEVRAAFSRTRDHVTAFALTPWKEHCTECAMPACYATCDLYVPRRDGKCRRFVQGIEMIPMPEHPQGYVAKVAFKRWGQLMAYANARLVPVADASAVERRARRIEAVAAGLPGASITVAGRRGIPSRVAGRWKQRASTGAGRSIEAAPDCLMLEVYNPASTVVRLSLSVSNPGRPPFEALLDLHPGFQSIDVAVERIRVHVDLDRELLISLDPNIDRAEDEGLTLYFGLLAFVVLSAADAATPAATDATDATAEPPVRVAVWDLDETLWSGTLIEDGLDAVRLRDDAVTVVRELDRRGIVNSIVSKNHPDDGLDALRHFGIDDLFVFPKIGWIDKGASMAELARDFGLDVGGFAFIDDQPFERAQVIDANPGLRAYDSQDVLSLLDRAEFRPAVSAESSSRRSFYRGEEHRGQAFESTGGDYLTFLRTCDLRIDIRRPDRTALDRVHELVQRTNQLNHSGTRYSRHEVTAIVDDRSREAFVISCTDAFGDYGTIGFVVVDRGRACLSDAMFSCRVRFKHVEHAALCFLLHRYRSQQAPHFDAQFREMERNADAASVFADLGFVEVSRHGADRRYRFDLGQPIPDEGIVTISYEGVPWDPSEPDSAN